MAAFINLCRATVSVVVATTLACRSTRAHGDPGTSAAGGAGADSVQGVVQLTGTESSPEIALAMDNGLASVSLVGPSALRAVAGLRVAVVGARSGRVLLVGRFVVVAANGVPATDGIVVDAADGLSIITADGTRHRLVSPSPALRAAAGHRVWVSGSLDGPIVAYGVIE